MDINALTFRTGTADDAEMLRDFVRATFAKWVPVMGREPLPMTADCHLALARHQFRLAFDLAGLAGVIETEATPGYLWVESIAVRADLQGRGLGRVLLGLAEAEARDRGLPDVRLVTNAALTSNIRYYQNYGFWLESTEPFMGGLIVRFRKPV